MSRPADMATIANHPMQFLVDQPSHVNDQDFEKVWSEIIAQLSPNNCLTTIDFATYHALTEEQVDELCRRWV